MEENVVARVTRKRTRSLDTKELCEGPDLANGSSPRAISQQCVEFQLRKSDLELGKTLLRERKLVSSFGDFKRTSRGTSRSYRRADKNVRVYDKKRHLPWPPFGLPLQLYFAKNFPKLRGRQTVSFRLFGESPLRNAKTPPRCRTLRGGTIGRQFDGLRRLGDLRIHGIGPAQVDDDYRRGRTPRHPP
jgi:hypothetical protein